MRLNYTILPIHADVITNRKDEILDKNTKFIITELEYDGILGMPTLNNFDIKFYDQSISLINNKSGKEFNLERINLSVCNIESLSLKPMESKIILLKENIKINNAYALVGSSAMNQSIPAKIANNSIEIFNDSSKFFISDDHK